jgi:sirohydrochlorin ferrochelatase
MTSITRLRTGILIVDHGSRLADSNRLLEEVAATFGRRFAERYPIVEPAHMELAEPSIATAYDRCVQRGAERIIVTPYFLGPGKHWTHDIPRLTAAAAEKHPGTRYHVTPTLGIDELILDLLAKRATWCEEHQFDCELCHGTIRCGDHAAG